MISLTVPETMSLRAGIILLAGVAAAPAGLSQSRIGADLERQQQIIEQIQQEESRNGPYSEFLIAPLSDLALLYQDRGDHDLAVAVLHRVRQVVRANEGLHSLEQIPLLQQIIANEEAIGRLETAWELEQDLLALARRHPGDMRTVPVFRETAAKRMAVLRQYLAGEFPPQITLGCYYAWPDRDAPSELLGCIAGDRGTAIRGIVADAQENYYNAVTVMHRNELYASDELHELELKMVQSIEEVRGRELYRATREATRKPSNPSYDDVPEVPLEWEKFGSWWLSVYVLAEALDRIVPESADPLAYVPARVSDVREGHASWDYSFGRKSLERLWSYETVTSAPLEQQVAALVRIADWDLLYSRNQRALEQYERAYATLAAAGAQAAAAELFWPDAPVVLPALSPNPLNSGSLREHSAYIDVAFEVTRYGESQRVRILDTTTSVTDADKASLVRLIQRSRFRPRVTNGAFARATPVVLRYHLTD